MGLFSKTTDSSSSANHTCPTLSLSETSTSPIAGSWSFHQLNVVISGAAVAFSCLSIFALMANHAMHLSKPKEQLKIMRISIFIPIYGILCFLSIVAPQAYVYIHPWTDLAEAMALGNFFLLLCEFVSPNQDERDTFFAALHVPAKQSRRGRRSGASSSSSPSPQDGLAWFRKKWVAVFQFIPVSLLLGIFTCITAAANVYCLTSNKPYFAHLWLNIFHFISLAVSIIAVLAFYRLLKPSLTAHSPLTKLLAFKLLIGLNFLLGIIFTILNGLSNSPLAPSEQLSYSDVTVGIPMLVNCLLMVPFSLFFHYAYSVKEYHLSSLSTATAAQKLAGGDDQDLESQPMNAAAADGGHAMQAAPMAYHGGPLGLKAWVQVWSPMEILRAIAFSFSMASKTGRRAGGSAAGYYSSNQTYAYDQPPNMTESDEQYNSSSSSNNNNNSSSSYTTTSTPPAYGQHSEGRVGGYGGEGLQNTAYNYHNQDSVQGYGSNTAYQGAGTRY